MRILQLTRKIPFPLMDGESIAVHQLAQSLYKLGVRLDLLSLNTSKHPSQFDNATLREKFLPHYERIRSVEIDNRISYFNAALNLFSSRPFHVSRLFAKNFFRELNELLGAECYDFLLIESSLMMVYVMQMSDTRSYPPIVLRTHNLETEIWLRQAKIERNILAHSFMQIQSAKLKSFEQEAYQKADMIWAISSRDCQKIKEINERDLRVINLPVGLKCIESEFIGSQANILKLCFIGSLDWKPNISGIQWFLNHVWPYLLDRPIELHIAGKNCKKNLFAKVHNVHFHGEVPDSHDFMRSFDLMIVPLLSGSGVRIKILEAMSNFVPVMCTALAHEGIDLRDNVEASISDLPTDWVARICSYSEDRKKLIHLAQNARDYIHSRHDPDQIARQALQSLEFLQKDKE